MLATRFICPAYSALGLFLAAFVGTRAAADDELPTVPGFGVEEEKDAETVPGFGDPVEVPEYSDRIVRYVDEIMDRYDKDGNDLLDAEEMKRVRWSSDPKPDDKNGDGQMNKAEMLARIAKRWGDDDRRSRRSDSGRGSSDEKKSSTPSSKIRRYAQALLGRYDSNKNGVLERDEWAKMRGPSSRADANNDGTITLDELAAKLGDYGRGDTDSKSSSTGTSSRNRSSSGTSRRSGGDKKIFRITSPTERLPRGLPDWFARNDADADGQIAMSEFSASWSDSKAAEFAKYDANRDGMITPAECLAVEKGGR